MAYRDELDAAVAASNQTLRDSFARNPIEPNRPASEPAGISPEFGGNPVDPSIPTEPPKSFGIGGSIDYGAMLYGKGAPKVDPSATAVRGSGEAPGETPGPITAAAKTAFAPGRPGAVADGPVIAAGTSEPALSVVPGNPNYKAEYALMRAQERQGELDAAAGLAQRDAANKARVDEYYARQAAENAKRGFTPAFFDNLVTNASTVGATRGQAPDVARGPIAAAAAPAAGAPGAPRNLVQEELAAQAAQRATAVQDVDLKTKQLALEQQKRIFDLGSRLGATKDPKEREQLSSTLLAMLGKDKPEEYQVVHAAGAETLGPDGFTKLKGPDSIVVINKRTGAREILPMGGQAAPAAAPAAAQPAEGARGVHKDGYPVVFKDGRWQKAD